MRSLLLLWFVISWLLLRWRPLVVWFAFHHVTWRRSYAICALPIFKSLTSSSIRDLPRKSLFLVALATAKRVGEVQVLSRVVSFSFSTAGLSYVPEFLAKTETSVRPLPRSFSIHSLQDFAAGLPEDLLLCPVCSLREYLRWTSCFVNWPSRLFVSPRHPSCAISKNGILFLLREVIAH